MVLLKVDHCCCEEKYLIILSLTGKGSWIKDSGEKLIEGSLVPTEGWPDNSFITEVFCRCTWDICADITQPSKSIREICYPESNNIRCAETAWGCEHAKVALDVTSPLRSTYAPSSRCSTFTWLSWTAISLTGPGIGRTKNWTSIGSLQLLGKSRNWYERKSGH